MEIEWARAVAQVVSVPVDSAKVEVEYDRVTCQESAPFLDAPPNIPKLPPPGLEGITTPVGPIRTGPTRLISASFTSRSRQVTPPPASRRERHRDQTRPRCVQDVVM